MNQDRSSKAECPSFEFGIVFKDRANLLILILTQFVLHNLILVMNRIKLQNVCNDVTKFLIRGFAEPKNKP